MINIASKNTVKVKIDIQPGPVSPTQKQAWRRFWQKLLSEQKNGDKND